MHGLRPQENPVGEIVEYMYARGKGCTRGTGNLEHDGGCLG